jgi:hypothetical protein
MVKSDNYTEYGIHNTGERSIWIIYLMFALLSSLIGDSIILIASIKYNAIKLNKFIVVLMQHIAACDILAAITFVLPTMISLIANKWVLGDAIAYIQVYLNNTSIIANNILICTLTSSKLLLLQFPLHVRKWTAKKAHIVSVSIWIFTIIPPAVRLVFDRYGPVFSYTSYNIDFGLPSEYSSADKIVITTMNVLVSDIPTIFIIISTCFTLAHLVRSRRVAKRSGRHQRWQGIVTVVATATVFCFSIVPFRLFFLISEIMSKAVPHPITLGRIFESLFTLNIICNFFIYSLTIPSFRKFLKSKSSRGSIWRDEPSTVAQNSVMQERATDGNQMHTIPEGNRA